MIDYLQNIYNETTKCIRCGYCLPTCPTYVITGLEHAVARGRNYLAKTFIEQEIEFSKEIKQSIFECLLCGACVNNCTPAVPTNEIMTIIRATFIQSCGQPPLQRFLFKELLQNPERMTRLMKLISMGKRSGISGLVKALRVFNWFGKNLAHMESLLETFPKTFLRELIGNLSFENDDNLLKIIYFFGCGINYAFPDVGLATLELLKKDNVQVVALPNYCCGLPALGYGDIDAARTLALKNLQLFKNVDCDLIVTDCASCASFLKEYPNLLREDSQWSELAQSICEKVMELSTFLYRFSYKKKLKVSGRLVVTYHDPCHLSHYLHITKEPRDLICQIDGIDFRELPEANWCCGGAGTYNISHYELSMKILKRKMQNLQSTGAEILVTACPGCLVQLSYGVRIYKLPVTVMHISQLMLKAFEV